MNQFSVTERLDHIERELLEIKAAQGRLKLSSGTVLLLWVMLAAIAGWTITSITAFVRLETKVDAYMQVAAANQTILYDHLRAEGHPVATERIRQLKERLDQIESRRTGR